jgi:YfiH family protein
MNEGGIGDIGLLVPDWPVNSRVRAACTTRAGGVSETPYGSLNLALHVGDAPAAVLENRQRLRAALDLPAEPLWLEQVHGIEVARGVAGRADACVLTERGAVAAIQVADCMPVLLAADDGSVVGAAHAGWRGLAHGVLEATVASLGAAAGRLSAWLGPAIGAPHFEVGAEVRDAFLAHSGEAGQAFSPNARGRWQCDLELLVRQRLAAMGVTRISGGGLCTYGDPERFFSFRRDGRCGRMAALIWLE